MLCLEDTKIEFKSQGFKAIQFGVSPTGEETVLMMESIKRTADQHCPRCCGSVHIYDSFQMHLKDMPLFFKTPMTLFCTGNRYRCTQCKETFTEEKSKALQIILQEHHDLAVCYAMKEEMCRLYELTDYQQALDGWMKWFEAAKASEIRSLVKFATQKEKRLPGLAAHAVFRISTGKLEGFNNKIKVAKRIAYGYRDEDYFFTLIRYLALPSTKAKSPNFS